MCGRYSAEGDWSDFPSFKVPESFEPNLDLRPTDPAVTLRLDGDTLVAEMRRWGFLRTWPGPSGKWVSRQLFNAVGEEVEQKRAFRDAYRTSRCIVPMNAWYEWPIIAGKKTRVRISMPTQRCFGVAGLFESSRHPKTDALIETFTIITVPPNELLGTVHDRAPLVLRAQDYEVWLEGGAPAQSLVTAHPEADAFKILAV